jgi:hypothetical protein
MVPARKIVLRERKQICIGKMVLNWRMCDLVV